MTDLKKEKQNIQTLFVFAFFFWLAGIMGMVEVMNGAGMIYKILIVFGIFGGLIFTIWGIVAYNKLKEINP